MELDKTKEELAGCQEELKDMTTLAEEKVLQADGATDAMESMRKEMQDLVE